MKPWYITRQWLFLLIVFIAFSLNYSLNFFGISNENFIYFDRPDEGNIIGRLDKSKHEGFFSYGGLTGRTDYVPSKDSLPPAHDFNTIVNLQYSYFLNDRKIPGKDFSLYKSQPGGQAMMYSLIQIISPLKNKHNIQLFRIINALLTALAFTLFIGWCYRNFGIISSSIVFFLLLISFPLIQFGYNLWWALWSFYIPFLTLLLLLEKRQKKQEKYPEKKTLAFFFLAFFAKCFFTGFEFITSTIIMAISPIIYYGVLNKEKLPTIFLSLTKTGLVAVMAVLACMVLLVLQIKMAEGTFMDGINHIIYSYTKRSSFAEEQLSYNIPSLIVLYLSYYPFLSGLEHAFKISYGTLILIIAFCSGIILFFNKKLNPFIRNKNKGLVAVTLFSVLSPVSWFVIFTQHAVEHTFLDYITWFMPFLLFGFLVIGACASTLIKLISKKKYNMNY